MSKGYIYLFEGEAAAASAPAEAPAASAPAAAPSTLLDGGTPAPTDGGAPVALPEGHAFASLGELAKDPNLAKFAGHENPLEALAKGYQNAATLIGKDPTNLVDTSALTTPEAKLSHFQALGAPKEAAGYEFKAPEGVPAELAEGPVMDVMKDAAVKAGVLPEQFQAIVGAALTSLGQASTQEDTETQGNHEKNITALKEQHGDMFDNHVRLANLGLEKEGGEKAKELQNLFAEAGIGTNPLVINFLAGLGERHTEDTAAGLKGDMPVPVAQNMQRADELQSRAIMSTDPAEQRKLMDEAVKLRAQALGETLA